MSDLIKLAFLFGFQFTKNVQRKISINEISSQNKMKSPMWPEAMNLTVTMLNPIQSPRIPPEFATNQMTGIFWSLLKRTFLNIQCDGARPAHVIICSHYLR